MSIQRERMQDSVKRILLDRILNNTYPPGTRLLELEIAEEMNTSQGPVREALKELEGLRLVESQPYQGTYVRGIDLQEMCEAYQVRAILEKQAARSAVSQFKNNPEPLISEVQGMKVAAARADFDAYAYHDAVFHRLIVEASGNSVLLRVWDSLAFEARTRINLLRATVSLEELALLHQPIVEALISGNEKKVGRLLQEHFEAARPLECTDTNEQEENNLIKCPECKSTQVNKNGRHRGKQRYKCKECNYQFVIGSTYRRYSETIRQKCLMLHSQGKTFREIERLTGVHHTTLMYWSKQTDS